MKYPIITSMLEVREWKKDAWAILHKSNSAIVLYCKSKDEAEKTFAFYTEVQSRLSEVEERAIHFEKRLWEETNKVGNRNALIQKLREEVKKQQKVILLMELWCKNSARGMATFEKSHPNYKLIQEQIKIYNDTLDALNDFKQNYQTYNLNR